jgi:hypothetical protein
LGVFSLGWDAIAHAPLKRGKATFTDMGAGVVYIPFYYNGKEQVFVSDPFYLDAKKQPHYFHADKSDLQTVTIDRKYPIANYKIWWSQLFVNARFESSKDRDFTQPDTLFTIKENTYWRKIAVPLDVNKPSRFYRFINQGWPLDLAEISFFDSNGEAVTGTWIGDTTTMNNPGLPNIHDGDRLSFATIQSWVGMDFGREIALSRIEYTPRNDANGIYPGMKYELMYFDRNSWVSMGVKTAVDYSITFEDIPKNALLWLRNLTEGKEERIFEYKAGKQKWL